MKKWHRIAKEYIESNNCELISKDYKNAKTKIRIKCSCGVIFTTTYDNFKTSKNKVCGECSKKIVREKRSVNFNLKAQSFIESKGCKLVSDNIPNAHSIIVVECGCGENFNVSYNKFQSCGQTKCRKCSNKKDWSLSKLKKVIEDNGNELMSFEEYTNLEQEVEIKCYCGSIFTTTYRNFLYDERYECESCISDKRAKSARLGFKELQKKTRRMSNSKLIKGREYKDYKDIFTFECECGTQFKTTYSSFIAGKRKCSKCVGASKMEKIAQDFFEEEDINYEPQYSYEDLRGEKGGLLRFDFAVKDKDNNVSFLLELDGEQHFKPVNFSYKDAKQKYKTTLEHDSRKNNYCKENNINLLRIPYYKKEEIKTIIKKQTNMQTLCQASVEK